MRLVYSVGINPDPQWSHKAIGFINRGFIERWITILDFDCTFKYRSNDYLQILWRYTMVVEDSIIASFALVSSFVDRCGIISGSGWPAVSGRRKRTSRVLVIASDAYTTYGKVQCVNEPCITITHILFLIYFIRNRQRFPGPNHVAGKGRIQQNST